MNILYTLNNDYFPQFYVSVKSLISFSKNALSVYVICDDLTQENLDLIHRLNELSVKVRVLNAPRIPTKLIPDRGSKSQYYRLFLGEIFKDIDIDRVLYLDCDTLIVSNKLSEMFCLNMSDNVVAATVDPWSDNFKSIFKINSNEPFLNSGMYLVDLKKWKYLHIDNVISQLINNRQHFIQGDQGILNEQFAGKFKILPAEFNLTSSLFNFKYKDLMTFRQPSVFYTKKEVKDAIENPVLIHFTSSFFGGRPWFSNSQHPYANKWQSAFYEYFPQRHLPKEDKSLLKRVYDVLPHPVAIRMIGFFQNVIRPAVLKKKYGLRSR